MSGWRDKCRKKIAITPDRSGKDLRINWFIQDPPDTAEQQFIYVRKSCRENLLPFVLDFMATWENGPPVLCCYTYSPVWWRQELVTVCKIDAWVQIKGMCFHSVPASFIGWVVSALTPQQNTEPLPITLNVSLSLAALSAAFSTGISMLHSTFGQTLETVITGWNCTYYWLALGPDSTVVAPAVDVEKCTAAAIVYFTLRISWSIVISSF